MDVDGFRSLIALRYAAESIDEVNVFLNKGILVTARALEVQLRSQARTAKFSRAAFASGAAAALVAAFSIGGEFLWPGLILATYLGLMFAFAIWRTWEIEDERKMLILDQQSIENYLRKAMRDRRENKVSVAIQNRKAAAILLNDSDHLDSDSKRFLKEAVTFWGQRINKEKDELDHQDESGPLWKDHADMLNRVKGWITDELNVRPLS